MPLLNIMERNLTSKQEMFCREYLVDLNATQAAIRAGYSRKTARNIACEYLAKPHIKAKIQEFMDKRVEKTDITAEKVLSEIAKMAFANIQDYITVTGDGDPYVDLSKLTRDQAAAIQEIAVHSYTEWVDEKNEERRVVKKIKFKLANKKGSLDQLCRHLSIYNDTPLVDNSIHHHYTLIQELHGKTREPVSLRVD